MSKDPYNVLGVTKDADDATIKTAFRNLAKQHHGDADPTRFTEIKDAYDKISSADRRAAHERERSQAQFDSFSFNFGGPGGGGYGAYHGHDITEILRQMMRDQFGGDIHAGSRPPPPTKNRDISQGIEISLHDAYKGCEITIRSPNGEVVVKVPAGVVDGTRVRVAGHGRSDIKELPPGDLYLIVTVRPDATFNRNGKHLMTAMTIDALDVIMGKEQFVTMFTGEIIPFTVPLPSQPGSSVKIAGKGMPAMNGGDYGDLFVYLNFAVNELTNEKKDELGRVLGLKS